MSSRVHHWLFIPLGWPVKISICLKVTVVVGACLAVGACLLEEREMGRDMAKISGRVVGLVAMILSLVAAEG